MRAAGPKRVVASPGLRALFRAPFRATFRAPFRRRWDDTMRPLKAPGRTISRARRCYGGTRPPIAGFRSVFMFAALFGTGLAVIVYSARVSRAHAIAPDTGRLVGGPFQRVIYYTNSHITLAVPGRFREGTLQLSSASVRYNDQTGTAWTDGPCLIQNGGARAEGHTGTADFRNEQVTLGGGVRFDLPLAMPHGRVARVRLSAPTLHYDARLNVARCEAGSSGQIDGIDSTPAGGIAAVAGAIPGETGTAIAPTARGPVFVRAMTIEFTPTTRTLTATGGVVITQAGTQIRSGKLTLDLNRRLVRVGGMLDYSDSAGRTLRGVDATENLDTRTVTVRGPLVFADRSGNRVQAETATVDQRSQVATLTGNVQYVDPHGMRARTPFVVVTYDRGGARSVRTGPLQVSGTAEAPAG